MIRLPARFLSRLSAVAAAAVVAGVVTVLPAAPAQAFGNTTIHPEKLGVYAIPDMYYDDLDRAERSLALMHSLLPNAYLRWDNETGHYLNTPAFNEDFIRRANNAGVPMIIAVCCVDGYDNWWAQGNRQPEESIRQIADGPYLAWAALMKQRYANVKYIETINEPDGVWFVADPDNVTNWNYYMDKLYAAVGGNTASLMGPATAFRTSNIYNNTVARSEIQQVSYHTYGGWSSLGDVAGKQGAWVTEYGDDSVSEAVGDSPGYMLGDLWNAERNGKLSGNIKQIFYVNLQKLVRGDAIEGNYYALSGRLRAMAAYQALGNISSTAYQDPANGDFTAADNGSGAFGMLMWNATGSTKSGATRTVPGTSVTPGTALNVLYIRNANSNAAECAPLSAQTRVSATINSGSVSVTMNNLDAYAAAYLTTRPCGALAPSSVATTMSAAPSPWVTPGTPVTVKATVTNNGATAINNLTGSLSGPAGWTIGAPSATVPTVAPGGNGQITWTVTPPSTANSTPQTFTATMSFNSGGPVTDTAQIKLAAGTAPTVGNQRVDTSTQGNWKGTYGSAGYSIVNDADSLPSGTTVQWGGTAYTWNSAPTETRALQRAGTGRIAATRFGNVVSVTATNSGTATRQIGLYLLDWDGGRQERITVSDILGNPLATVDTGDFTQGKYVVWDVKGSVTFTAQTLQGANAVMSGIFFGAGGGTTDNPPSAPTNLAASNITPTGATLTWTASSDDHGISGYQVFRNGAQIATTNGTTTTYAATGLTPSTQYTFTVKAVDTISQVSGASNNATFTTPALPNASVTNRQVNTVILGGWKGQYGAGGYEVYGDSSQPGSGVTISTTGSYWLWASSSTENRATQRASTGRFAACMFGDTVSIRFNITDGTSKKVSIYLLDWDGATSGFGVRHETITVKATSTGTVLDTYDPGTFATGTYVSWQATGDITVTLTKTAGANAVVSGAFIG